MSIALYRPYCSLDSVKREAGLSLTETKHNDRIAETINQASRFIDEMTHRDFWFHDHSVSPYLPRVTEMVGQGLYLPWPVISISSILISDVAVNSEDLNYRVGDRNIYYSSKWPKDLVRQYVKVYGTFGWAIVDDLTPPTSLPGDLNRACIQIAAAWSGLSKKEYRGTDGTLVSVLDRSIPKEANMILKSRYIIRPAF